MQHELFLDGGWHPGARGTFATIDPATGRRITDVAAAGPSDVAHAVASARVAVADGRWAYVPSTRRGQVLYHLAHLVQERAAEIARWETLDTGLPITVTRLFEVPSAVEAIRQAATATHRFTGGRSRAPRVVAIVVDARFTFTALVRELLAALVEGDAVIVAPSVHAPLTPLLLAGLAAEAGIPPGVLAVVPGTADVAETLAAHPGVDRVVTASFAAADKAVVVVTEDADIDELLTVNPLGGLAGVGRYSTGYRHVEVHTSRAAEFVAKLSAALLELRVGPARETDTECGPLGSFDALTAIESHVDAARAAGARTVVGGARPDGPLSQGWYYSPTVLVGGDPLTAGPAPDGPVIRVCSWRDGADLRDHRPSDLWSGRVAVWSEDLPMANRLATAVQAGQVYVNAGPVVETDTVWQSRAATPRPQTREPGLIPRGPGSRCPTAAGPTARRLAADRSCVAEPPEPPAARPRPDLVPASWGGQVRRFAARGFVLEKLRPIGSPHRLG